jgi:hypothetical protein
VPLRRVHPRVVHRVGGKLVEMVDSVSDISAQEKGDQRVAAPVGWMTRGERFAPAHRTAALAVAVSLVALRCRLVRAGRCCGRWVAYA